MRNITDLQHQVNVLVNRVEALKGRLEEQQDKDLTAGRLTLIWDAVAGIHTSLDFCNSVIDRRRSHRE